MTPLPISWIAVASICIMVAALITAFLKRIMITQAIVIANFIVFIISFFYRNDILGAANYLDFPGLGFRPIYLSFEFLPQVYTLFSSMFVHADFTHIIGNMIIFLFIGMAFENRIGSKKFLMIYLATGVCGTIAYSLINPNSTVTLVGASGAIFGILGAFAYAYPMEKVLMPIPIGIMFIARVKVITAAIIFALVETFVIWLSVDDQIAHAAHIGGLAAGLVISALFIKKKPSTQMAETDIATLKGLVKTEREIKLLKKIQEADVPEVRDAWLSVLLKDLNCPKCGKKMQLDNDGICKCGYRVHIKK